MMNLFISTDIPTIPQTLYDKSHISQIKNFKNFFKSANI